MRALSLFSDTLTMPRSPYVTSLFRITAIPELVKTSQSCLCSAAEAQDAVERKKSTHERAHGAKGVAANACSALSEGGVKHA